MTDYEIEKLYNLIKGYHKKYLMPYGVSLPSLRRDGKFTKDALVLTYLAQGYPNTSKVTKDELTDFIRQYYPEVNDVQQARHLGQQKGFYILSGTRKDNESLALGLLPKEYWLKTLELHYPGFTHERREYKEGSDYFESLKQKYGYRCATCGSKEGEPNLRYPNTKTVLQMGHMDPSKPLKEGNIIPQCEKCNRPDRNYWVYDSKGRVTGIANERVVDKCSKDLKTRIYLRLKGQLDK